MTTDTLPDISVIVATIGRPERLGRLMECLAAQTFPSTSWDLCVAIDGSDAESVSVLSRWRDRLPRLRWVETGARGGPAVARNRALAETRGAVVAMTDDDCEPQPEWLAALTGFLADQPEVGVVFGRTVTDPSHLTPFSHYVENHQGEGHQTCNCAYRREVLDALGGFDERFPFAYLEDTDLFCRAEAITQTAFCADALVIHPPRETHWLAAARSMRRYEADFIFHAKHPALYRRRHQGHGPLRELLWTVAVKHAARQALAQRGWLARNPMLYARYLLSLVAGSALIWIRAPLWSSRHRSSEPPASGSGHAVGAGV